MNRTTEPVPAEPDGVPGGGDRSGDGHSGGGRSILERLRRALSGRSARGAPSAEARRDGRGPAIERGIERRVDPGDGPVVEPVVDPVIDPVADLEDATFFDAVDGRVTVVDFWAPWCAPCRVFHPIFARVAERHAGGPVGFARLDVQRNPAVAVTYGITTIPTILVLGPDCEERAREVGLPGPRRLSKVVRLANVVAGKSDIGGTS